MILSRALIAAGSIVAAFGILFTAQSQSLVGPESSFMYRNPEWLVNGTIIAGVGAVMIAAGIILSLKRRSSKLDM